MSILIQNVCLFQTSSGCQFLFPDEVVNNIKKTFAHEQYKDFGETQM